MISTKNIFVLPTLMLLPSTAYASDPTGFFSFMYLILIVSISTAINLWLVITFYIRGKYIDSNFASKHAGYAFIIPLIGVLLAIGDHRSEQDLFYLIGFNLLAAVIAVIPLFIRE